MVLVALLFFAIIFFLVSYSIISKGIKHFLGLTSIKKSSFTFTRREKKKVSKLPSKFLASFFQ
jgi:hypothetical protein